MNLSFFAPQKKEKSFHQKQIINDDLMDRMHERIRALRKPLIDSVDLTNVKFHLTNNFEPINTTYGRGIQMKLSEAQMMGDAQRIEIKYQPAGEMIPHFCNDCYELIRVNSGTLTDKMINETYSKGSIVVLKKGVTHHLHSQEGADLTTYQVYTDNYQPYLQELLQN